MVTGHGRPFGIEETEEGRSHVIAISGELDLDTAPRLRERIHRAIAAGRFDLVVDASAMDFMDSSAISVLIDGMKNAQREGGRLVLRSVNTGIRRVLEIAGLLDIFGVIDDPPLAT